MNIEISNPKILKSLSNREKTRNKILLIVKDNDELREKALAQEADLNKLVAKQQREEEKIKPEILRELKIVHPEFAEYEEFSKCYLEEGGKDKGKVFFQIVNRLDEFKETYAQQKDNSSDTDEDAGGGDIDTKVPADIS